MAVKHCIAKRGPATVSPRRGRVAEPAYRQADAVYDALRGTGEGSVSRVACRSNNRNHIPSDIASLISGADAHAESFLVGAGVLTTLSKAMLDNDIDMSSDAVLQAYLSRFGPPAQAGDEYRNRFTGTRHDTEDEARASELGSISSRLGRMESHLAGGIVYRCNPSGRLRLAGCTDRCRNNWGMWTCSSGTRQIAVCPPFYSGAYNESTRALLIIHELGHNRLRLSGHGHGSGRQRIGNPECYASYVGELFNQSTNDSRCPPR